MSIISEDSEAVVMCIPAMALLSAFTACNAPKCSMCEFTNTRKRDYLPALSTLITSVECASRWCNHVEPVYSPVTVFRQAVAILCESSTEL